MGNLVDENLTTSSDNLVVANSVESVIPAQAVAPPKHHYDFRDGELYGYLGAISEEQSKKGVAAPPVVMFRYTGQWGGEHHLQWVSDSGAVLESAECNVPCVAIKVRYADGTRDRIGYSPNSIIGGAFEDAMNGRLQRSPAPGTVKDGYRFKGGDPGNPANWQAVSLPSPAPALTAPTETLTTESAPESLATNAL
jgi:hypothetical protein